jgi:hypothetical protein
MEQLLLGWEGIQGAITPAELAQPPLAGALQALNQLPANASLAIRSEALFNALAAFMQVRGPEGTWPMIRYGVDRAVAEGANVERLVQVSERAYEDALESHAPVPVIEVFQGFFDAFKLHIGEEDRQRHERAVREIQARQRVVTPEELRSQAVQQLATAEQLVRNGHLLEAERHLAVASDIQDGIHDQFLGPSLERVTENYRRALVAPFFDARSQVLNATDPMALNRALSLWQATTQEAVERYRGRALPKDVQDAIQEGNLRCRAKVAELCDPRSREEIAAVAAFRPPIPGRGVFVAPHLDENLPHVINARIKTMIACRDEVRQGNLRVADAFDVWWNRIPEHHRQRLLNDAGLKSVYESYRETEQMARARGAEPEPVWMNQQRNALDAIERIDNVADLTAAMSRMRIEDDRDLRFWRAVDQRLRLKLQTLSGLADAPLSAGLRRAYATLRRRIHFL